MSVFALRPRELRYEPIPAKAHLTRDDFGRVLLACLVALVLSGALIFFLLQLPEAQSSGPAATPIVKPVWADIQKPFRLFALNAPDWGRDAAYTAERHREGGRRDHLSFGAFGSTAWLKVTLYRPGAEDPDAAPFAPDMTRRAALAGLAVARIGQSKPLPTRVGSFDVAEVTLAATGRGSVESAPCLGFRLAYAPVLQIGGFACGTLGRPIDRARLACALDRIDLISAGDDTDLRAFFTGAKGQLGAACSNPPPDEAGEPAKSTGGFVILR
jgi:hypothetical protein